MKVHARTMFDIAELGHEIQPVKINCLKVESKSQCSLSDTPVFTSLNSLSNLEFQKRTLKNFNGILPSLT